MKLFQSACIIIKVRKNIQIKYPFTEIGRQI